MKFKPGFYIADKRHFDYFNNLFQYLKKQKLPFELVINDTLHFKYGKGVYSENYVLEMEKTAQDRTLPYKLLSVVDSKYDIIVSTVTYQYRVPFGKLHYKRYFFVKIISFFSKLLKSKSLAKYAKKQIRHDDYPEKILSDFVVSYPRGLDVNENYPPSKIDELIDVYFCHGNLDKTIIGKNSNKPTFVIGYPRYDNIIQYRNGISDRIISEFDLDPDKKLISWVPTNVNSRNGEEDYNITEWSEHIRPLLNHYNIILRPHPKRIHQNIDQLLHTLKEAGFKIDTRTDRDMSELYGSSEFVFCDYGGTIFSAIYTDCNLLLLNLSFHEEIAEARKSSVDIIVRNHIKNINSGHPNGEEKINLLSILEDRSYWNEQKDIRKKIREDYFGGVEAGKCSEITVNTLLELSKNFRKQVRD